MNNQNRQAEAKIRLFLYSETKYLHKESSLWMGEVWQLTAAAQELGTQALLRVEVHRTAADVFLVNGKNVKRGGYIVLATEDGEEVLAVVSTPPKILSSAGRIWLNGSRSVTVGNAFGNEIFYEFFSFIDENHLELIETQDGLLVREQADCPSGRRSFLYIEGEEPQTSYERKSAIFAINNNEFEAAEPNHKEFLLQAGETMVLLGLRIYYLTGLLVAVSDFGEFRMKREILPSGRGDAWRDAYLQMNIREKGLPNFRMNASAQSGRWELQRISLEERPLVMGEFALALPPARQEMEKQPLFLTIGPSLTMVLPMLLVTFVSSLSDGAGNGYYRMGIWMTTGSAILASFWGLAGFLTRKKQEERKEQSRFHEYRSYLERAAQVMEETAVRNLDAMLHRSPSCGEILQSGLLYYGRSVYRTDYAFLRLGLSEIPSPYRLTCKSDSRKKDALMQEAEALAERFRTLKNAPAGIDLKQENIVGFAGSGADRLLTEAVFRLAVTMEPDRLQMICLYNEEKEEQRRLAQHLKWVPHLFADGRKQRFLAGKEQEYAQILPAVQQLLQVKEHRKQLLFIVADMDILKNDDLGERILKEAGNGGCAVFLLASQREKLPGECNCIVTNATANRIGLQDVRIEHLSQGLERTERLQADPFSMTEAEQFLRKLSAQVSLSEEEEMPDSVSFLKLFGTEKLSGLSCHSRYAGYRVLERLGVPIGIGDGGRTITLDIHEKFHGPHGLVAGTTGSGKSELLQTLLLSLAVSFRPDELSFFMIDYKGGGLGNLLQKLPHCAGFVSNLSEGQIYRALVSIKGENVRRQKLLKEAGVSHITDYSRLYLEGSVTEAMPHLLLLVDEFAELKKEAPDFMKEIISVAQVGRSLGVHLLLATQKPAGTVDDRIVSNIGYKLCLKVAERQDSMDMLHRPEAAYLTGSGQCYLQTGNQSELTLFQTGYAGGKYRKDGAVKHTAYLVTTTGQRIGMREETAQSQITEAQAVTDYICAVCKEMKIEGARRLWMPMLPEKYILPQIYRDARQRECGALLGKCFASQTAMQEDHFLTQDRSSAAHEKQGTPCILLGLADDPALQRQFPVYYRPEKDGHFLACGAPSTGKSTLLQSMVFQLLQHSTADVCVMIAAAGSRQLGCFRQMPGCLGILDNPESAESFFTYVERLFLKRKRLLSGLNFWQWKRQMESAEQAGDAEMMESAEQAGNAEMMGSAEHTCDAGTMESAEQARCTEKVESSGQSLYVLVIDDYSSFAELTGDRFFGLIQKLLREGESCGFYLLMTAYGIGNGEFPARLFEKCKTTLCFTMSDPMQYTDVMRKYPVPVKIAEQKGRGIIKLQDTIYELQTPLCLEGTDTERIVKITEAGRLAVENRKKNNEKRKDSESTGSVGKKFPYIPAKPSFPLMYERNTAALQATVSHTAEVFDAAAGDARAEDIYLGYDLKTAGKVLLPKGGFVISGADGTGKKNVLYGILYGYFYTKNQDQKQTQNRPRNQKQTHNQKMDQEHHFTKYKTCIYAEEGNLLSATQKMFPKERAEGALVLCRNGKELSEFLQTADADDLLCFGNLTEASRLYNQLESDPRQHLDAYLEGKRGHLIVLSCPQEERNAVATPFYEALLRIRRGIHLGGCVTAQRLLSFEDLPFALLNGQQKKGIGFMKNTAGRTMHVLIPYAGKEEADDLFGYSGAIDEQDLRF